MGGLRIIVKHEVKRYKVQFILDTHLSRQQILNLIVALEGGMIDIQDVSEKTMNQDKTKDLQELTKYVGNRLAEVQANIDFMELTGGDSKVFQYNKGKENAYTNILDMIKRIEGDLPP